jgi:uncharacterized protein (DUF433 family)
MVKEVAQAAVDVSHTDDDTTIRVSGGDPVGRRAPCQSMPRIFTGARPQARELFRRSVLLGVRMAFRPPISGGLAPLRHAESGDAWLKSCQLSTGPLTRSLEYADSDFGILCDTVSCVTTRQRSFRLSTETLSLLDRAADRAGQSRNALAERLLGEALRVERHPLVRFQQGAGGRRQPLLAGTRLYVHQVVATVKASNGNVANASEYLGLPERQVRAALDYYAEFTEEVDADTEVAQRAEDDERGRWERRQLAFG